MKPPRTAYLLTLAVALPAVGLALADPAGAADKRRPAVTTGGVTAVTPTGVTVHGRVNPRGETTNVLVQYGSGKRLRQSTPVQQLAAGTQRVRVKIALANLAPVTRYAYRVVAYSIDGRTNGATRRFRTPRVPPSVTLAAGPLIVRAGQTVILSGTVGGTGAPGSRVIARARPFPFTAPFAAFTNTLIVGRTGAYSTFAQPQATTQFQTTATVDDRRAMSPIVTVGVRPVVSLRAKRYRSRRLRFYGTVRPAGDYTVTLRRLTSRGRRLTISRTTAGGTPTTSFRFGARRTKGARYLVLVESKSGALVKTESTSRRVAASRR